jgi:hypothetical protein
MNVKDLTLAHVKSHLQVGLLCSICIALNLLILGDFQDFSTYFCTFNVSYLYVLL